MENTIENKVRLFAQYYSQFVGIRQGAHCYIDSALFYKQGVEVTTLNLKSLSSISDEDAIEVGKIIWPELNGWERIEGKSQILQKSQGRILTFGIGENMVMHHRVEAGWFSDNPIGLYKEQVQITDFLRSKSYALPYLGLSVETQIEYGWVRLEGNN